MSKTEEIIQVCNALPEDKQAELVDFARFLLARQDDEAWERRLAIRSPDRVWTPFFGNRPPKAMNRSTRAACEFSHPTEFLASLCTVERSHPPSRPSSIRALCAKSRS